MEIYGYKRSRILTLLTFLGIICSGFLLRLIFYWRPQWMLYATHYRCRLSEADRILLIDRYLQCYVQKVKLLYLWNTSYAPFIFGSRKNSILRRSLDSKSSSDDEDFLECPDEKDSSLENNQTYGSLVPRALLKTQMSPSLDCMIENCIYKQNLTQLKEKQSTESLSSSRADDNSYLIKIDPYAEEQSVTDISSCESTLEPGCVCVPKKLKERDLAIEIKYFEHKKIRYIWDDGVFVQLKGLDQNLILSELEQLTGGLDEHEQTIRRKLFGQNLICVDVKSHMKILFEEVLGPFYIFQLFSVVLWLNDNYMYYALCIIVMSVASLISSVIQIRRNQVQLRSMIESESYVKVCRKNNEIVEIKSSDLVPGDVVIVPSFNTIIQFDALLLNGNVIVNESMLTGESLPITKTPAIFHSRKNSVGSKSMNTKDEHANLESSSGVNYENLYYDEKEHSKHTLFCGTKILQTRYYGGAHVKALVLRTGFQTTKGELVRSIMFPKPVDFRFNSQIHRFISILAFFGFIGFFYTVTLQVRRGQSLKKIIIHALDIITVTVPPALPAAMTIGIIYAQSRLKKNKIFCISPRSINISGCINCVCFDKTGTLTEDDLSFNKIVPSNENDQKFDQPFDESVIQFKNERIGKENHLLRQDGYYSPLMQCLASCHSLTIMDDKLIGDPLDLQMFEATGWQMMEHDENIDDELAGLTIVKPPSMNQVTTENLKNNTTSIADNGDKPTNQNLCQDIGVLHQFPFSSSLQRMSVIVRCLGNSEYFVYAKGAPEKIASLCEPSSLPNNFMDILHKYTRCGYRVIALAYKPLKSGMTASKIQRLSRQTVEQNLKFLGFLTLRNLLKDETVSVIDTLQKANIRTLMVTGDNILTAFSVANECNMIGSKDRTILLQVDNTFLDDKHTKSNDMNDLSLCTDFLILSTTNFDRKFNEMDPILQSPLKLDIAPKFFLDQNKQSKPTLTWNYINQEDGEYQEELVTTKDVSSVIIELAEKGRIHLALTGETWDAVVKYYPELLNAICVRGTVFARMSPSQKQQLVEHLQSIEYFVGMCGDGANDSGALRAAHTGISLSETEASVAAPFTSATPNIACVPKLISEGRAALVTAFCILKYMTLYSLTQFCSIILLYTMYSNFIDFEFMYEDLFIITILIAFFGRTKPETELADKPPPSYLLSLTQLSSCFLQLILIVGFQLAASFVLWNRSWYQKPIENDEENFDSQDNFAIFVMSASQCFALALVFSKGRPHKKSAMTNYPYAFALALICITTLACILVPNELNVPILNLLQVRNLPYEFRFTMLGLVLLHGGAAFFVERVVIDRWLTALEATWAPKPIYKIVELATQTTNWLPKQLNCVA